VLFTTVSLQSLGKINEGAICIQSLVVFVVAFGERWTRDRKVAESTPGRIQR